MTVNTTQTKARRQARPDADATRRPRPEQARPEQPRPEHGPERAWHDQMN